MTDASSIVTLATVASRSAASAAGTLTPTNAPKWQPKGVHQIATLPDDHSLAPRDDDPQDQDKTSYDEGAKAFGYVAAGVVGTTVLVGGSILAGQEWSKRSNARSTATSEAPESNGATSQPDSDSPSTGLGRFISGFKRSTAAPEDTELGSVPRPSGPYVELPDPAHTRPL